MKKILASIVVFCCIFASASLTDNRVAAENPVRIVDIQNENLLLNDGSLWVKDINGYSNYQFNIAAIAENTGNNGYGVTRNGELVSWDFALKPKVVPSQNNIRKITDGYYLKTDGTVWSTSGKSQSGLDQVVNLSAKNGEIAYVKQNGYIMYTGYNKALTTVQDPASIVSIATTGDREVAFLDNTGKVVIYNTLYFDDKNPALPLKPGTLTNNAAHISYTDDGTLLVTLKDGTVWVNGTSQDRFKLTKQIVGVDSVVKTSALRDSGSFYFQQKDGSWKFIIKGLVMPVAVPGIDDLTFTVSELKPYVGTSITASIIEKYSNGSTKKVPLAQANVTIEKPQVLKAMNDGTFKVLGVGETTITITSGSVSKSVKVAASLPTNLLGAKQVNNVTYLPIQSVFKAMGGTSVYTAATKSFAIQVGNTAIKLKTGDAKATVNGKQVVMSGAVRTENGSVVFPASLLTQAFGAVLKWDDYYEEMIISFGLAKMTVQSEETNKIVKRDEQGALGAYIGKVFWINHFQDWDRFAKVTITDVVPEGNNSFIITFKKENGTILKSFQMQKDYALSTLTEEHFFFNYDPQKKYKWSKTIWDKIKAEKISIGMNKDQVRMSWGDPSSSSTASGGNITVETWGYGGFNYVTFTNGKVSGIYTS